MNYDNRVVWSEGMFLRVQHFQQADRWIERLLKTTTQALSPFGWGVSALEVDLQALTIGRFALSAVAGIMPDGTVFSAPGFCDLPPALELPEGVKNKIVYLSLPTTQPGLQEIGDPRAPSLSARYQKHRYDAPDANAGSALSANIEVARMDLRLRLEGMEMAGFDRIPIARIVDVRQDRSVILDNAFIATTLICSAHPALLSILSELLGVIGHRAEAIADRMGDPSVRGTAEVADFQFLQALNRYEALFRHHRENPAALHPERLYALCAAMAGELSSFTKERRRGAAFPGYRHGDLESSFAPVMADLQASLSSVLERSAIEIPLEQRRYGVRVGIVSDRNLLANSGFILAARADVPTETLRSVLPRQIKIGPVERISELVNVALPGIGISPLPVAPRQLPYRAGASYFELNKDSQLWPQLNPSGAIAMHLTGDFPSLELELWAIKA